MMSIIIANPTNKVTGIQVGAKTHHQDQAITLVNFRTINTIVKRGKEPMPVMWLLLFLLFILYKLSNSKMKRRPMSIAPIIAMKN